MQTVMFPGQGSQARGMGAALFARFPELVEVADAILGYSIRDLCLDDPLGKINDTRYTQPALYTISALSYLQSVADSGREPDFLIGHSLGEFNALLAAGCFDFATGLELVRRRGELMGVVSGGGMAAVINASAEDVRRILDEHSFDRVFIANYNAPSQIVVSGSSEQIGGAAAIFNEAATTLGRVRCVPLNTSGAFHSPFMQDAMGSFRLLLRGARLSPPRIPVIANATARPYASDLVADTLADQIGSGVKWYESVQYLLAIARSRGVQMHFVEVGSGKVLTRLLGTILKDTCDDDINTLIAYT